MACRRSSGDVTAFEPPSESSWAFLVEHVRRPGQDELRSGRPSLRFAGRFGLRVRRAVGVLIDKDRVSVRIDQHQTGRAGGRFISLGSEREPFGFKALLNLPNIGELLERRRRPDS